MLLLVKRETLSRPPVVSEVCTIDSLQRSSEERPEEGQRRVERRLTAMTAAVVSAGWPCLGIVVENARQRGPGSGRAARQGNQGLKQHLWVGRHSR